MELHSGPSSSSTPPSATAAALCAATASAIHSAAAAEDGGAPGTEFNRKYIGMRLEPQLENSIKICVKLLHSESGAVFQISH